MSTTQEEVLEFVRTKSGLQDASASSDIFATGGVSSLFAVQIVMWVQSRHGIDVGPDELTIDNFRTPERIAQFIDTHREADGGQA